MENFVDITDSPKVPINEVEQNIEKEKSNFTRALVFGILICLASIILFSWKRIDSITISAPILNDLFGTFGDFIGGFLGTIVAFYTAYLLVKTFQNQIKTNANVVKTNESVINANQSVIETNKKLIKQTHLQIFDSRFSTLLNLYKGAIADYHKDGEYGRQVFEAIVKDFRTNGLINKTEYKRRSISAVMEYLNLYSEYRQNFSVHFRMLYLLARLTAEEKIEENYRISYAKNIRGQLSDSELLIIRYNCLSPYGEKMRTYVNKFNLIKHLPITSLLEFSRWRKLIADDSYCSSVDRLAISLKKLMTGMLDSQGGVKREYKISSRLMFDFNLDETHESMDVLFSMQKVKKNGGAIKRLHEERAFDAILSDDIELFLKEFFTEIFIYSNFFRFNGEDNHIITTNIHHDTNKEIAINIKIARKGVALALADHQVMPS